MLNWHHKNKTIALPKTATESRLKENIDVHSFELSEEDCAKIAELNQGIRLYDPKHIGGYGWNNIPYYE